MEKQLIEPAAEKPPLDPAQVPTRGLSKEQKRHIRRAMGVQAADMVDDILHKATASYVSQQAVAREVLELRGALEEGQRKLGARLDGQLGMIGDVENLLGSAKGRLDATEHQVTEAWVCLRLELLRAATFQNMGIVARLRWVLFGTVPASK